MSTIGEWFERHKKSCPTCKLDFTTQPAEANIFFHYTGACESLSKAPDTQTVLSKENTPGVEIAAPGNCGHRGYRRKSGACSMCERQAEIAAIPPPTPEPWMRRAQQRINEMEREPHNFAGRNLPPTAVLAILQEEYERREKP